MISLTRLNGEGFVLNCDMIERVEATPDTHILLTDGTRYVVKETPIEVTRAAQAYKAGILAMVVHIEQDIADGTALSAASSRPTNGR